MDNPTDKLKPMGTQSKETVDLAAAKARDALDSTRKTADQAIDKVADKADKAADLATERLASARQQVRTQVANYSEQLADYAQNEPIKAMLIAAAAGALLMGLVTLMARSDD